MKKIVLATLAMLVALGVAQRLEAGSFVSRPHELYCYILNSQTECTVRQSGPLNSICYCHGRRGIVLARELRTKHTE
jgi:hypothetical protein